jgi:dienelactone hydrolase
MKKQHLLITVAGVAVAAGAALPSAAAAQAPPMGGAYKDVIAIPVDEPNVKAIAGALFEPEGVGPFPAVIYLGECSGLDFPPEKALQKIVIASHLAKGVAVLIVDPFTPRQEPDGVCEKIPLEHARFLDRETNDAYAALRLLAATPGIDPKRVFLEAYSFGAHAGMLASGSYVASKHDEKFAGLIAFYPYCGIKSDFAIPTIAFVGDKDEMSPARLCLTQKDNPNLEVVVYPGATHGFASPGLEGDFAGHHMVYDEKAAKDAHARGDAFIAAHTKEATTQ